MLGSSIIKSLVRNLLEKLGSDLLGTWNLAENVEINSFSPLDIELSNVPVPQIVFEVADLPFIVVYSNVRRARVQLKMDKMPSEENALNVEAWDVDLQLRLASVDEWDSRKWCKRLLKSKRKKIWRWYKYCSPWTSNKVADQISQSLETSLANSLDIRLHNVHCLLMDDYLGPEPFALEILSDSFCISSPSDQGVLSEEELQGKKSNLLQFLWIRFYGLRAIFRRFDGMLLTSVPKNVVTKLVDIEGDAAHLGEEGENSGSSSNGVQGAPPEEAQEGFLSKLGRNVLPFLFSSETSEAQKIGILNSVLCGMGAREPSQMEYLRELTEISTGSREFSAAEAPRHTQNGNSRFVKLPEDPAGSVQITRDEGVELHILFKRWDIRALNAPNSMFGSLFEDDSRKSEYISSRDWKTSKLIFLPSSERYLRRPPSQEEASPSEPFELKCTEEVVSVLYNFVNYLNQWSAFLKASQYIYNNRIPLRQLEEYLSSLVSLNRGCKMNGGPSKIPKQLLAEMESEISIRDLIALHMSADKFLRENSSIRGGLWGVLKRSPEVDPELLRKFVAERALRRDPSRDSSPDWKDSGPPEIEERKLSTFGKWFSSEGRLQVSIPKARLSVILSEVSSISSKVSTFPDWMRPLLARSSSGESLLGKIPGLVLELDLNLVTNKISFYHRLTTLALRNLRVFEHEFGLVCAQIKRSGGPERENASLIRIPSHATKISAIPFLPSFKIAEIGCEAESPELREGAFEVETFSNRRFESRAAGPKLKLEFLDSGSSGEPARSSTHLPENPVTSGQTGILFKVHQLFGCTAFKKKGKALKTPIPGFSSDFEYCVIKDDHLSHFNLNSLEVSDFVLFDFQGFWKLGNLVPNVTSNINSIISRSHKEEEIRLVRSLITMIKTAAGSNPFFSVKIQNLRIASGFPSCCASPSKYSTRHLYLQSPIQTSWTQESLRIPELGLSTFRVASRDERRKETSVQDRLENKVPKIISEILASPEDFLLSLKTYRVMESSQSLFKGLAGFTMNSSIGNLTSFDFDEEEANRLAESLLYNEILRYLLQNNYFVEESVSVIGVELGLNSFSASAEMISKAISLQIKGLSLSMLANRPGTKNPADGTGRKTRPEECLREASGTDFEAELEAEKLEVFLLEELSLSFSEKQAQILLSRVSSSLFPAVLTLVNGYELLIFPKRNSINLAKMFDCISSFRKNKLPKKGRRSESEGLSGLGSLERLKVTIEDLSVQIYDVEYPLYQLSLFGAVLNYRFDCSDSYRATVSLSLEEIYVQSIANVLLKTRYLGFQQLKREFLGRHFFIPSVIFSKLSGHLVPASQISSRKKRKASGNRKDPEYPYVLVHPDTHRPELNTAERNSPQDPLFKLEIKVKGKDKEAGKQGLEEAKETRPVDYGNSPEHDRGSGSASRNKYVIILHLKVTNGNLFFSDDEIIRFRSVLALYLEILKKYKREKNLLWSREHIQSRESLFARRESAFGTRDHDLDSSSPRQAPERLSSSCLRCGGHKEHQMGQVKNQDEYFVDFSLSFENFYIHFLVNSDKLFKSRLIDNQLTGVHKEAIEFSNESLTFVRPLFSFKDQIYNERNYNPRTAVLTAESVGDADTYGHPSGESNRILVREWRLKAGFRELDMMVVRNGTWGMLDFSMKKMALKLWVSLGRVLEYSENREETAVLKRFLASLRLLARKDVRKIVKFKFKIRDVCVWSILYERINQRRGSRQKSTTVDMYLTKTSSSLDYVSLSPRKSSISEYSSSLLPEFLTVERGGQLDNKDSNEKSFPSWEYGLSLPLPVPFNHKELLLGSRPKIFPVFGKRPLREESCELGERYRRRFADGKEVFIIPIITLSSNEVDLGRCEVGAPISIEIIISPTFLSMVPLVFRQLVDISYMFERFMTVNRQGVLVKKSKASKTDKRPWESLEVLGGRRTEDPKRSDSISGVVRLFKGIPVPSLKVNSKFNTMVVIFPELSELEESESVSSRYFEAYYGAARKGGRAPPGSGETARTEVQGVGTEGAANTSSRGDEYFISAFSNKSHPALAFSHSLSFSFALASDREGETGGTLSEQDSLRVSLEISQLRVQLPFIRNIGGGYEMDSAKELESRESLKTTSDEVESRDPILDVFIPSTSSCFVLSQNSPAKDREEPLEAKSGVLFGMVSIPIVFAIDGARIPVMDDTFVLRNYALRRGRGLQDEKEYRFLFGGAVSPKPNGEDTLDGKPELRQEEPVGTEASVEEDPCFADCMMNRPELLGVVLNAVGDHFLQIQASLNNFRFIFSLTTFAVSAPYIQKLYSWWSNIWLIRMRYPRCPRSTMRYFFVDPKNDFLNISSFGLVPRNCERADPVQDELSSSPKEGAPAWPAYGGGTDAIYNVNRFDYLHHEITNSLFFPLDESIPVVIALPPTACLEKDVRPWNSLEFETRGSLASKFEGSLRSFNAEILFGSWRGEKNGSREPAEEQPADFWNQNRFSGDEKATPEPIRLQEHFPDSEGGVKAAPEKGRKGSRSGIPDPFLVCVCRHPKFIQDLRPSLARADSCSSESRPQSELEEFDSEEEAPAKFDFRLSRKMEQNVATETELGLGAAPDVKGELSSFEYLEPASHSRETSKFQRRTLFNGWSSFKQRMSLTSFGGPGATREGRTPSANSSALALRRRSSSLDNSSTRKRSLSFFKRKSSNELVPSGGLLPLINEAGDGGKSSLGPRMGSQFHRREEPEKDKKTHPLLLKFQLSLNNLEIWFHRDPRRDGLDKPSKEDRLKDEIDQLTLEEVSVDWMSKAVYCLPAAKARKQNSPQERDHFKITIQNHLRSGPESREFLEEEEEEEEEEDRQNQERDFPEEIEFRQKCPLDMTGSRKLFANSYEVFEFRKNISTYDQADYDYIMKSSRYGRRQGLAVHRYLKPSSSTCYIPYNSEATRRVENLYLDSARSGARLGEAHPSAAWRGLREDSGGNPKKQGLKENQFLNGTAFSVLLSLDVSTEMMDETFRFSGECNEIRILPGFPVGVREETLRHAGVLGSKTNKKRRQRCTCNYCRISALRRYLYLHTLNGRNIYLGLSKVSDHFKKDFLLYVSSLNIYMVPSGIRKSQISENWTNYQIEAELVINEVTVSVSMDILQEVRLFTNYYKDIRDEIAYHSFWSSRSRNTYICPEAILNPFLRDGFGPSGQGSAESPLSASLGAASSGNRRSFLSQIFPTTPRLERRPESNETRRNSEIKRSQNKSPPKTQQKEDNLSDSSSLSSGSSKLSGSSISSDSHLESQVIFLYYSGFPLPHSNLIFIPESVKRHLKNEQLGNLNKDRRFGIYAARKGGSELGKDKELIEHLVAENSRSSQQEGKDWQKEINPENTLYSVISGVIRHTSLPLDWIFKGSPSRNLDGGAPKLLSRYRFLRLLKLPKLHLERHRQLILDYKLPSFNIIVHNDGTDIIRLNIEDTRCSFQFPDSISCRVSGIVSVITHDPVMDCMITIVRPFPYTLGVLLGRSREKRTREALFRESESADLSGYPHFSATGGGVSGPSPLLEVDFRTESISLELTSGFLQNLRLILSDKKNSHLLGLVFAYERRISSVKIFNDLGQSFIAVQPVSIPLTKQAIHQVKAKKRDQKVLRMKSHAGGKKGMHGNSPAGMEETRGLRNFLLGSGEFCSVSIKLPVYVAIQKFTHRKGQKIAARIQAGRNSDYLRGGPFGIGDLDRSHYCARDQKPYQHFNHEQILRQRRRIEEQELHFNGFLKIPSEHEAENMQRTECQKRGSEARRQRDDFVIELGSEREEEPAAPDLGVGAHPGKTARMGGRLRNSSNVILGDILGEMCTLGISKRKLQRKKHLWLEEKKSELLYGPTGVAESELRQLAEQLELVTPTLGAISEGLEMMIHRFLASQSVWSSLGKIKDDTLYRRAYRFGTLGFLVVLEPESGTLPNEWIWTLGTCVQIENATNTVFRVTANWRHGIRHLCGTIFAPPISGERTQRQGRDPKQKEKSDSPGQPGHRFPFIDVPPYSRRSIPLSWFLLSDMEPTIMPLLTHRELEEEEDFVKVDEEEMSPHGHLEFWNMDSREDHKSASRKEARPGIRKMDRIWVDEKSVRRIQSKIHSVPFGILKSLIHEIMATQPGNVAKAKTANESSMLNFESLMAFGCQVECMDIPTSDKYVTSYSYSVKLTPLLKLTNSLPFPMQIRLKTAGGTGSPSIAALGRDEQEVEVLNISDFNASRLKSLAILEDSYSPPRTPSSPGYLGSRKFRTPRSGDTHFDRLRHVYRQEFGALIQLLSGKSVDYIIQPQQELELPICRQKLSLVVYVNGSPLESCSFPLFTNTQESVEYIQSRNAQISEFIYRSGCISVSFPFGNTITQNVNLRRISGNPFNAWSPFYNQLLRRFFASYGGAEESTTATGESKLVEALSNFTISISTSSRRILFSVLSRIENTTDSIICLFFNDLASNSTSSGGGGGASEPKSPAKAPELEEKTRDPQGKQPAPPQKIRTSRETAEVRNLLSTNYRIVPLPPMFRYFTAVENLKNMRIGSFTIDFLEKRIVRPVSGKERTEGARIVGSPGWNEFTQLVSNNLLINYVSKLSSKYDFSSLGASYSIKLPLTPLRDEAKSSKEQTVSIGAVTHNNDILSQLNCPFLSFYNKYELVSQLPFPIFVHKFINSKEMLQTIQNQHSKPLELETDLRDASIVYFRNSKSLEEDTAKESSEVGKPNSKRHSGPARSSGSLAVPETPERSKSPEGPMSPGSIVSKSPKDGYTKSCRLSIDSQEFKFPPRTSLSCDGILLRPNERRPYHDNDPNVWICRPLLEGSPEPLQASKEFSLFSGQKLEYTPQLNKFQVVLHPQQLYQNSHGHDRQSGSGTATGATSGPKSGVHSSSGMDSEKKGPLLITIQIVPAIIGSAASGSTTLRDSAYFVIFSLAEAPFFEICNLSNYYIAYDTPEISRSHNYYYRSKKAVLEAVSVGTLQLDDLSRSKTFNGGKEISSAGASLTKNKPTRKKTYVNHLHGTTGYIYPDIFSAKSADISVIPPKTKIPYIPKTWDCEFIGIRPFNVRKSVWTTHSVTSIKDQISVISFIKQSERKVPGFFQSKGTNTSLFSKESATTNISSFASQASDSNIQNGTRNASPLATSTKSNVSLAYSSHGNPNAAIPPTSPNGLVAVRSKPKTGKLYVFLMVNSRGTRVLMIMDNKKYAEKLLNGSITSIANSSFWDPEMSSLLNAEYYGKNTPSYTGNKGGRNGNLESLWDKGDREVPEASSYDNEPSMQSHLSPIRRFQLSKHEKSVADAWNHSEAEKGDQEGSQNKNMAPNGFGKIEMLKLRKISWLGLNISFFIPRVSISWIHQNELVLVSHGSLFHVSASVFPQNLYPISILNFTSDYLMGICYRLIGFSKDRNYRKNVEIDSGVSELEIIGGHGKNSFSNRKNIMALFSHGLNSLFNSNKKKRMIFGKTIQMVDLESSSVQSNLEDQSKMQLIRKKGHLIKKRLINRLKNGNPDSIYPEYVEEAEIEESEEEEFEEENDSRYPKRELGALSCIATISDPRQTSKSCVSSFVLGKSSFSSSVSASAGSGEIQLEEPLSEAVKEIYQFLSRNLNSAGGLVSPKENPVLNNVLRLLRKVYKDCVSGERYYRNKFPSSESIEDPERASGPNSPPNFRVERRNKVVQQNSRVPNFEMYDGVLLSLLRIIVLLSGFMEHSLLSGGKIILSLGLSSIHVDHFLPGDIPVILKTSSSLSLEKEELHVKETMRLSSVTTFESQDDILDLEGLPSSEASPGPSIQTGGSRGSQEIAVSPNEQCIPNSNAPGDYWERGEDYTEDRGEEYFLEREETQDSITSFNRKTPFQDYDRPGLGRSRSRFLSVTVARSLMNPMYAPIFDEINIAISQICCNLERLVVQTLYFMVSKEIENMNNITFSRQKTLWVHSTKQKMVKKKGHRELNYLGSLVCYVSGYGFPMYITRTPWDHLKIGKPLYIRTLEISDIIVTITIRTSDDTIDIDTLTPEALLFMNILPLDTPHMILNVNSLQKNALVVDIAEFLHFLVTSYSRQLKRRVLPSLGVTHLIAIYSGLKRGFKSLFIEIKRGVSDEDLTWIEGFIQGFRVGLIHFFRYFLGGTFQTASVIFNFGHKLLGGRRPRPKSILDAIWNGIVGQIMDTFITPWILLYREPPENFRRTNKKSVFVLTIIFSIVRIALSSVFGLLNLLASITESLATTLIGDFEQFVHVQSRAELMNEIETERVLNQRKEILGRKPNEEDDEDEEEDQDDEEDGNDEDDDGNYESCGDERRDEEQDEEREEQEKWEPT
ncbi:putative integral membrane protein [Cryptosporidium felis]|nr:putative integral membrane protein [Cryptosporidium felis]